ncbi:MAG: monofunctional biosynthetic peptidoglycan transglycosylase [Sphingobacteriales bacterium]|nr:MAG: monofunctional biosynthetic peptidoglycan transglycosylase [Sphingobacteriales bacterium]TAF83645.1 MAG: monofunctional biosynthetic peptidoglycan transglycosylase [Sphingobacteriales bacterium]
MLINLLRKVLIKLVLWFFAITFSWVLMYKFINPPITYLMLQRGVERKWEGKHWKLQKEWKDYHQLSNNLKKAAIAGEDARFMVHNGFDFKAMERAIERNKSGKKLRGGSTISQQTAKNVFLWAGRSYLRKAFEAYFTVLIELLWSKQRILEIYLNVIETGDGLYGAQAATQAYYGIGCQTLTKAKAALLVACLPNPRRWNPAQPTAYIYHRQYLILRNMRNLSRVKL